MKSYIIYGLPDLKLIDYVRQLNSTLGIEMVVHESSYSGLYYRSGSSGEHFVLQPNYVPQEGEWMESKYQEYPLLLYVNETTRPDELDQLLSTAIPSARKLQRQDL